MGSKATFLFAIIALQLLITSICSATTIYVRSDGNDLNSGLQWSSAKRTIGAGINVASAGDEVWVASGTYQERLTLRPSISIHGGFNGTEEFLAQKNPLINLTIVDADKNGNVIRATNISVDTTVDGFTLRNSGTFDVISCSSSPITISKNIIQSDGTGKGILCSNSDAYIYQNTVQFCDTGIYCSGVSTTTIESNTITSNVRGIHSEAISSIITHNTISGNNAGNGTGAGIYCSSGTNAFPSITANIIRGNNAGQGAGLYCVATFASVSNNIFDNNMATEGSAIYLSNSSVDLSNNTIVSNTANVTGEAGIQIAGTGTPTINNNIIAFNTGHGISRSGSNATPSTARNCFYNNTGLDYNNLPNGTGDLYNSNPQFVDAPNKNYHIRFTSPCLNAGVVSAFFDGSELDIDNQPRTRTPGGTRVIDIGADQHHDPFDFTGDGRPDLVLQNQQDIVLWYMINWQFLGGAGVDQKPPAGWNIVGVRDFNGDYKPDLVLQNQTSRAIVVWYMDSWQFQGGTQLGPTVPAGWRAAGIGDFNKDGYSDVVLQNENTGALVIWYFANTAYLGGLSTNNAPPADTRLVGTGDFNRDGNTDFVFQNRTSYQIVIWYMNNQTFIAGALPSTQPPSGYNVVGVRDSNGDTKPDIILQYRDDIVIWYMDNWQLLYGSRVGQTPPLGWNVRQ